MHNYYAYYFKVSYKLIFKVGFFFRFKNKITLFSGFSLFCFVIHSFNIVSPEAVEAFTGVKLNGALGNNV